jgi:pyruvate dehydrogenase E2 component (dihydrolipoamide acetyltransferase)
MLAFLIKACRLGAEEVPRLQQLAGRRRSWCYKQYFHIGFAADTPNGLVVPVIKDADKKGVLQISQEMGELAKKARDGKLGPADMSGRLLHHQQPGWHWRAVLHAHHQCARGGHPGRVQEQMEPVWDGKQFVPRLMLPLSLSWDHRVIDGAAAARFNAYLGQILGDFRRVLL